MYPQNPPIIPRTFNMHTLINHSLTRFDSVFCRNQFVGGIITHTSTYSPLLLASLSTVYQDPNADDNNSPVSLSVTSMVPLPPRSVAGNASEFWKKPDGEGFRPCLGFSLKYRRRSVKIVNEKKRFLVVVVSGDLLQIRAQIIDAVVIARILEAALVFPVLKGDESEFSEILNVEHFKKTLKADIRVVSSLPSTHLLSWQSLENQIPHNVPPFWIRARFFKKLNEDGSLVLTGLDSKLSQNLSPDLQKLKCKVAFHALKVAKPVRELGNRSARRMWIEGPNVAVHPSLEKDLWVRTGCLTGLGPEYDIIINEERESRPEFLATSLKTNFPLNALEAARLLKESGAPENAWVYIAGGESFGGDRAIPPSKTKFDNVVTKHMLARDSELDSYRNRTTGHRAYVGHRKYVAMSMSFKGQPQLRAKRRDRDVIVFPVPECMCKQ